MIVYTSRTGNVRWVINQLTDIECVDIKDISNVDEDYLIFTYTDGIGNVPSHVLDFLENNGQFLRGVIASGNVNFGSAYCLSADIISDKFGVPIIAKLDLRGTKNDRETIEKRYKEIIKRVK